ncbi:MAG: tetratricopeptide repeat protein, partial [Chitinophagaceae bacterium]
MKKTISVITALVFTISITSAQTVADAVKSLSYGKNKTAKEQLQKLVAANDKDANAIYWLGQSMIIVDDVAGAKAVYQKALTAGVNEPLIWIGMAHIDLLEGDDWNAAAQKFEQAITFTTETKGKNKGKPSVAVLNAIGRANCMGHSIKNGGSKFGNPDYAIQKLTQASTIDPINTECFIYMGLCYRKMGGEFGGEAQKAYTEALSRNPNNPWANYLIGKIYLSQQNKPFMEQYFNAALANDAAFAPVYLDYYNYYSNRDVAIAKENIEKYLQYADKDCNNDYFYADYLFRAGKFQES